MRVNGARPRTATERGAKERSAEWRSEGEKKRREAQQSQGDTRAQEEPWGRGELHSGNTPAHDVDAPKNIPKRVGVGERLSYLLHASAQAERGHT